MNDNKIKYAQLEGVRKHLYNHADPSGVWICPCMSEK